MATVAPTTPKHKPPITWWGKASLVDASSLPPEADDRHVAALWAHRAAAGGRSSHGMSLTGLAGMVRMSRTTLYRRTADLQRWGLVEKRGARWLLDPEPAPEQGRLPVDNTEDNPPEEPGDPAAGVPPWDETSHPGTQMQKRSSSVRSTRDAVGPGDRGDNPVCWRCQRSRVTRAPSGRMNDLCRECWREFKAGADPPDRPRPRPGPPGERLANGEVVDRSCRRVDAEGLRRMVRAA